MDNDVHVEFNWNVVHGSTIEVFVRRVDLPLVKYKTEVNSLPIGLNNKCIRYAVSNDNISYET